VEDGTLRSYVGGWPEYVRVREERAALAKAPAAAKPAQPKPRPAPNGGPSKKQVKDLEGRIERAEAELARLEEELADPSAWNDPRSAEKSTKRHARAKKELEALYAQWEAVAS
jgi:ATP-binding cassette subfamily F protein 3